MLLQGTFEKAKVEFLGKGATTDEKIRNWKVVVQNIRQLSYDAQNRVRICAADFVEERKLQLTETEASALYWSLAFGKKDPSCAGTVKYRLELLLDKPDDFYLTW